MLPPILHEKHQVTTVPPLLNTTFSRQRFHSSPDSTPTNSQTRIIPTMAEMARKDSNQGSSPSRPANVSPTTLKTAASPDDDKYPSYEENGRMYHSYRKGVYLYPCDELEQDRLDIFHKLFSIARFDHLYYSPINRDPEAVAKGLTGKDAEMDQGLRVLDLGCGTGIWAMAMAAKYRKSYVLGIDLAAIQPRNRPPNCDFHAPRDFEGPWALGEGSWDFIHLRMGCGSVSSWPNLYKKVFDHLRPGTGWFEQVEIDFQPRCDATSGPVPESMATWYKYLKDATESVMKPIAYQGNTKQMLIDAGFEVSHQFLGLPMNTWPTDAHEKDVGRWYNLAISESLETMSLAPFSRCYNWPVDRIRSIAAEVKSHAFNKEVHAFNVLHIFTARKPFPDESLKSSPT